MTAESEKGKEVVLRPGGSSGAGPAAILLVVLLIVVLRPPVAASFRALPVFLTVFLPFCIFQFVHIFENYRIIIKDDNISLPKTNVAGFPVFFAWGRDTIPISSIRRIVKYPPLEYDGNRMGRSIAGEGWKISITYHHAQRGMYLAYGFWGEDLIEELIYKIQERNKDVQIIGLDHLFKEDGSGIHAREDPPGSV